MQDTGEPHRNGPDTKAEETGPRSHSLPDQSLSPVLNPLLANQLGRWAEIYYTTPAENREEAVRQLLQELEAEAQSGSTSWKSVQAEKVEEAAPKDFLAPLETQTAFPPMQVRDHFVSAAAPLAGPLPMEISEAEHLADLSDANLPNQNLPNSTLSDPTLSDPDLSDPDLSDFDSTESSVEAPAVQKHKEPSNTPASQKHQDTPAAWPGLEAVESADASSQETPQLPTIPPLAEMQEGEIHAGEGGSAKSAPPDEAIEPQAAATHALFEPSQDFQSDFSTAQFRKLLLPAATTVQWIPRMTAVVALLVVGFTAMIWTLRRGTESSRALSGHTATTGVQQAPTPPAVETTASGKVSSQEAQGAPGFSRREPAQPTSDPIGPAPSQIARPAGGKTAIEISAAGKPATEKSAPEPTDPDLEAGLQYLRGNPAERNSAEAARHLWKSVRRQNGRALLELAGLYAKGDGVEKDCDQAKILLQAASRHKVSRIGTAFKTLRRAGCE